MSKYKYSETEKQINSVLKHQDEALKSIVALHLTMDIPPQQGQTRPFTNLLSV